MLCRNHSAELKLKLSLRSWSKVLWTFDTLTSSHTTERRHFSQETAEKRTSTDDFAKIMVRLFEICGNNNPTVTLLFLFFLSFLVVQSWLASSSSVTSCRSTGLRLKYGAEKQLSYTNTMQCNLLRGWHDCRRGRTKQNAKHNPKYPRAWRQIWLKVCFSSLSTNRGARRCGTDS